MPVWLVCTSMFSASGCSSITLACQATTPSLRLKIEVVGTCGARLSSAEYAG